MATNFQMRVPRKPGNFNQITHIRALITLAGTTAVNFRVTDQEGVFRDSGSLSNGGSVAALTFPTPAGMPGFDVVTVAPPNTSNANDPLRRQYKMFFTLRSDYDPGNNCQTTMPPAITGETWRIEVINNPGGGASPEISGACLLSYDLKMPGAECGTQKHQIIPTPGVGGEVAEVVGQPGGFCPEVRPGVDAVLVLDRSGSMSSSTLGGAPQPKIEALRDAVTDLVNVWNFLRSFEDALPSPPNPPNPPDDKIGVALFNQDASWWTAIPDGLNSFATAQGTILTKVNTIAAGGSTSIGDGLILADSVLNVADPTRRRVILLMSDGQQNADKLVGFTSDKNTVLTHPPGGPTAPLSNQDKYQIYTVTVGTGAAVSAQINQDIATATDGFYVNSEDNAGVLSSFFLELLQNFLHFSSWQTYRLVSQRVSRGNSYSTSIRVTTTTQFLTFNLRWPAGMYPLRLSVLPPGELQPTVAVGASNITMQFNVPTSTNYDYLSDWQVAVELNEPSTHLPPPPPPIPFELVVLGEDSSLDSEMNIVAQDYVPGDQIELEARLVDFGLPVSGLESQSGATLVAQVVKPGVGIGDLLSSSKAPTTPDPQDASTPAESKLQNELQQNPQSLVRDSSDTVTLTDSGDGVYRGKYAVQTPGHYNFLFGLQGESEGAGRFSRMQLKTVHVRPAPDAATTQFQTSIKAADKGSVMTILMTPLTKFGHKLGPGWANYFWFTSSNRQPFKATDNLNGTYTAEIAYSGLLPPQVGVHFLPISMVIADSVTADQLPVPLDNSNLLTPNVNRKGCLGLLLSLLIALLKKLFP